MERAGKSFTLRIVIKYALFQLPELLLFITALIVARRWFSIPPWFFWGFIVFLIAKDAVIFPFVWRAYDNRDAKRIHQLIGQKGMVVEPLKPYGVVRVNGELWKAEMSGKGLLIDRGEYIRVEDVKGYCLLVGKADPGE
jgi:membrane protein implicated in regulation of membrane protease activity